MSEGPEAASIGSSAGGARAKSPPTRIIGRTGGGPAGEMHGR